MFLKTTNPASPASVPAKTANKKAVPTVISSDMHVLGNVVSEGIIDFDGTIDGNVHCFTLVLRHNGKVNGEVHADNVQVYGRVKGLIKAKTVQLHSTCCVEGIIMHEAISIEDGAIIDGKIKRTNKATSASTPMPFEEEYEEYGEYAEPSGGNNGGGGSGEGSKMLDNIRLLAG